MGCGGDKVKQYLQMPIALYFSFFRSTFPLVFGALAPPALSFASLCASVSSNIAMRMMVCSLGEGGGGGEIGVVCCA